MTVIVEHGPFMWVVQTPVMKDERILHDLSGNWVLEDVAPMATIQVPGQLTPVMVLVEFRRAQLLVPSRQLFRLHGVGRP